MAAPSLSKAPSPRPLSDEYNHAGAYAYGKTAVAAGYDAAGACVKIRRKPRSNWLALMPNAHEGYVSWDKAETIRKMVSSNVPTSRHHGAPKHGDALRVEFTHDPQSWQRCVGHQRQTLPREVVDDCQNAEPPTASEASERKSRLQR